MSSVIPHMIMGLQSSGKTTFAAALWYLIDSGEVPTVLTKGLHTGDHTYLEHIAGSWENTPDGKPSASGRTD
jgi:hypothetical protein